MSSTSSYGSDTSEPATAIVIDNGSYSVKCGFGGEDAPETCFVTYHDVTKTCEDDNTLLHENYHFVDERDLPYSILNPGDFNKYPVISEGVVKDWDCLEALWEKFLLENKVDCSEQPVVMLSAISNNSAASTRKFCEISFEKFGFKKLCIAAPETMALVASGKDMAVVTNIGYDNCVSVPTICPLNGFKKKVTREAKTEDVKIFPVKVGGKHVSARFRTVAAPERKYSPWIGASIFSSLSGFGDYGLSNLDFEEHGPDGMEIL
ncbi:actin-2-like [Bolinopsis microptera]|uniref:actin-2-like n=1 Tax=Bolinopsis microptera TaxID=2820187 RepID=UPI003079BBAC